jgi:hypothetical protein
MGSPLTHFKFAQFHFHLKVITPLHLPEYKGATLRGGFGYAFKKVVCALRSKECGTCLLKEKCVYSYIFETPPPGDSRMMRKYPSAPHPFVLLPPLEEDRIYETGEKLSFHLTLIGKAINYLPYFIYTFEELGKMGLGKEKGNFSLEEVEVIQSGEGSKGNGEKKETIYSGEEKVLHSNFPFCSIPDLKTSDLAPRSLTLVFLTPTRLKFQEELTSDLKFHVLFRNLIRRISLLSYFHCGQSLDVDFRRLIKESELVQTLQSNLHWHDWARYSTRQSSRMNLGGVMGKIVFSGDLKPFWPYLLLGEWIHVGKGSSFGLGKYEILKKD